LQVSRRVGVIEAQKMTPNSIHEWIWLLREEHKQNSTYYSQITFEIWLPKTTYDFSMKIPPTRFWLSKFFLLFHRPPHFSKHV
jgi:hypothetical protein